MSYELRDKNQKSLIKNSQSLILIKKLFIG